MIVDQFLYTNKRKKDSTLKSALKALSWRILGTLDTIIISLFITGNIEWALAIGSVEVISKMVLYYLHERLWTKINLN